MGCISSKITVKSQSFREELNQSLQSRVNGFPMLEDLLNSKNGGDEFLALVCTANSVAKKIQTGALLPESDTDVDLSAQQLNHDTINTWELMSGLEEEEQKQRQLQPIHREGAHKSEEQQLATEQECSVRSKNFDIFTKISTVADIGGLSRSKSFHTMEEYDALVRAIDQQSESGVNVSIGMHSEKFYSTGVDEYTEDTRLHLRSRSFHTLSEYDCSRDVSVAKKDLRSMINDRDLPAGKTDTQGTFRNFAEPKSSEFKTEASNCAGSSCASEVVSIDEDVTDKGENVTKEKGFRRRAMAKDLSTLSIPTSTIDFPAIGSSGGWRALGGQVFFSGEYVTPKFGDFNVPVSLNTNAGHAVFDPDMVAAFEEAMTQFTVEEECILKQIVEDMDEEGTVEKEVEGEISNNIEV